MPSSLVRTFFSGLLGLSVVFVDFVLEAGEYGIVLVVSRQAFGDLPLALRY
jgi:hypothetical protein